MSADLNAVQATVIDVRAVVSAIGHAAGDGAVGGAVAAVIGTSSVHGLFLPNKKIKSGQKAWLYCALKLLHYTPSRHFAKAK